MYHLCFGLSYLLYLKLRLQCNWLDSMCIFHLVYENFLHEAKQKGK